MKSHWLCFFCFLVLLVVPQAYGQRNLNELDFSRVDVEDLTDEQILSLWDRAEAQGLTLSELEKMAIARGMRPDQVVKLRARIRELQSERRRSDRNAQARRGRTRAQQRELDELDEDDPFAVLTRARDAYMDLEEDTTFAKAFEDSTEKRIFGQDLFNTETLTFEPSLNIPTPQNYQLGPGDELVVDVWGAAEMTYQVPVTRDGTIRLENLGPLYVNGLTIEEAKQRILSRLSQLYAGLNTDASSVGNTFADVSLSKVRTIKVHILGEVKRPGSYTLPSLATVFNALYVCGGPNDNGSFRKVQVIRNGSVQAELDVYDFLIHGQLNNNVRLLDQDIIKVDPYLARIEIEGEVKRPALYEVRPGETLQEAIHFAGAFSEAAYTSHLKVYRNTPTERRILSVAQKEFDAFPLRNGDHIFVEKILDRFENRVEVKGAVYREGEYELGDARTVYGLIQRANGLKGDAFLSRGQIYRTRDDLTVELISFNLGQLIAQPEEHDIPLKKDDVVIIPSIFDLKEEYTVEVDGSVQKPGEYPYMESMTLQDLIVMAEGLKDEASLLRIEVSRRRTGGTGNTEGYVSGRIADIFYFQVDQNLALESADAQFALQPFDKVFVRKSPGYIPQRDVKITGEVVYPGTYSIANKQDRISDLITRAGGLTPEAYPRGAILIRTESETGAVGINLEQIMANPQSSYDLLVEKGDSIYVPVRLQTVKITGAVYRPVNVRFEERMDLMDYISRAGGPTDQADLRRAYIVYANGSVDRIRKMLFVPRYPDVEPGAEIVVPVKPEEQKMSAQERTLVLSSIVSIAAIVSTTIFQILQQAR